MKRLMLLVAAIGLGALAIPAGASAASGDIQELDVLDAPDPAPESLKVAFVFDDGDKIFVRGNVECRVEDTWGIIMKAVNPARSGSDDFQTFGPDNGDFSKEALGFGGPGSG